MQKTVLPCSTDGLRPFVAPDGSLPCPSPSTFNILKFLQENPDGARSQVEWMEVESVQG